MPSRVAVLDLRAQSDGFLSDGGLARLAARLERAGHDVARLDATWPGEPALRSSFVAALERRVRDGRFDTLIVARAWDSEMLDALRRALPAGKLLRLSGGHAGSLDDRFDAVVDEQGAEAAVRGAPIPAIAPRPTRAAELRALRVLDPRDELPESAGARPAIRGPATGCPYLVDSRSLPAFARLELDRHAVQTRGCTFCLDNTGAYAAATEDETVERWVAQLRMLRRETSEGRLEVLLMDERPHPHLPRLFREIADDPALGAIELLVKSRVDWLLEHEGMLSDACTIARSSGSIVHVYLVGFESFDPETLELFNKGTSVEDNVRAIALLRELARRFPESFEHRRLRAHGFVAFTPWTTPEALLRNARAMREVGFEELRADAARTRLRLHPRTPLYALAEADGLLTGSFGARADRASEQGYDASFAWRFADPRVEAIFGACEGLRSSSRDLGDADLLEIATRFVLRWPGLASAPEVAHLPLVRAVSQWKLSARELGSTLGAGASVDLELERLAAGEKRALLKEGVPAEDVEGLLRAYRAMGLAAGVAEHHGLDSTGGAHLEGEGFAIVAVARTEDELASAIQLQRGRDMRAMGEWMGYPACCVEAFLAQPDRRDNVENERWTLRRSGDGIVSPWIARLGRVQLVSHHPCRVDCAASIAIAERGLARIAEVSPEGAEWIAESLTRAALFLDHARGATLSGEWSGSRFRVTRFEPLSRALEVKDVTDVEVLVDGVSLLTSAGELRTLRADRPLLVVPGEPLPPVVRANVAPSPAPRPTPSQAPRWLELTPDYRCNQRCVGCGAVSDGGPSRSSRELVQAMIDGRRQGITQLWIGGGEPTLRRDLLPLVRDARARGYTRVRLQTNAAMLAYPEVVRRLADAGITEVAASIKGPDAATHDRLARAPGAFDLLCRGIENARECALVVEGDVLVYRSTTALLPATVRAFFERGVERFRAWMMAPDPRDAEALAEEPRWSEMAAAVRETLALGLSDDPDHLVSLHSPPCTLESARARFFAPELGLLVHDASGHRFRLETSEIEGGTWPARCGGCALRPRCNGVRAGYVARHGDAELRPRAPLAAGGSE